MVSIIVPTYNRANFLDTLILSVQSLSFSDWELLIVDDGSTDNSKDVIAPFLTDLRIKYFYQSNSGASKARNYGLKNASREWVVFLDSDDLPKTEWLCSFKSEIANEYYVISCKYEINFFEDSKVIFKGFNDFIGLKVNYLAGTIFYRKKMINEIYGFDDKLESSQHTDLFLRLAIKFQLKQNNIFLVHRCLLAIFYHNSNRIRNNSLKVINGALLFLGKHKIFLNKYPTYKSNIYSVISFNYFLMSYKKESIKMAIKALSLNFNLKNIMRLIRCLVK